MPKGILASDTRISNSLTQMICVSQLGHGIWPNKTERKNKYSKSGGEVSSPSFGHKQGSVSHHRAPGCHLTILRGLPTRGSQDRKMERTHVLDDITNCQTAQSQGTLKLLT